mgnify:CR=1 FL=1
MPPPGLPWVSWTGCRASSMAQSLVVSRPCESEILSVVFLYFPPHSFSNPSTNTIWRKEVELYLFLLESRWPVFSEHLDHC